MVTRSTTDDLETFSNNPDEEQFSFNKCFKKFHKCKNVCSVNFF